MNTNQIGNGDEGVNVSPRSPVDAGGSAEFARLLREGSALLADAANFAERLGQERENVVGGGVYAFEAIYALKTAPSASAEWGDPIAVDGKRPEWFRQSDHGCIAVVGKGTTWEERQETDENTIPDVDDWDWPMIDVVQLPASHPYYLATSRGFTYWPGGDEAPSDWDGNAVLHRDGVWSPTAPRFHPWRHINTDSDVIGYRRKPEEPACNCLGDEWSIDCPVHILPPTMPDNAFQEVAADDVDAEEIALLRESYAGLIAQGILAGRWADTVPLDDVDHARQLAEFALDSADALARAVIERRRK